MRYRSTNYGTYGVMVVTALALATFGCAKTAPAPADGPSVPAADAHAQRDHAKSAEQEGPGADDEVAKAMASLSPEDRAAAEKQRVCLVTGEPLGSMGAPIKVTVNGRDVFLCCEGCRESLMKDPDKYLAKLTDE